MTVSVLIPVYNVEPYLRCCLDSIVAQTYKNLQVVMVDDGSSDGSLAIAQEYCEKYPWMEVHHQENQGVAAARNALLGHIKGEYTLFVDADDWIEPDMIEYLESIAVSENADMIMCRNLVNDEKPSCIPATRRTVTQSEAVHDFLCHEYFRGSLWNKLLKSSLLQGEKFDSRISYGEDALFCWKILQKVNTIEDSDRQLYHYRMSDSSISHLNFGPKKYSGHLAWEIICSDCEPIWPEYLTLAKAQWASQNTQLLLAAGKSGYQIDDKIITLQDTVKKNWAYMRKHKIGSWRLRLFAFLASRFYGLIKFF